MIMDILAWGSVGALVLCMAFAVFCAIMNERSEDKKDVERKRRLETEASICNLSGTCRVLFDSEWYYIQFLKDDVWKFVSDADLQYFTVSPRSALSMKTMYGAERIAQEAMKPVQ
jgi:hypothetical protein